MTLLYVVDCVPRSLLCRYTPAVSLCPPPSWGRSGYLLLPQAVHYSAALQLLTNLKFDDVYHISEADYSYLHVLRPSFGCSLVRCGGTSKCADKTHNLTRLHLCCGICMSVHYRAWRRGGLHARKLLRNQLLHGMVALVLLRAWRGSAQGGQRVLGGEVSTFEDVLALDAVVQPERHRVERRGAYISAQHYCSSN